MTEHVDCPVFPPLGQGWGEGLEPLCFLALLQHTSLPSTYLHLTLPVLSTPAALNMALAVALMSSISLHLQRQKVTLNT